MSNETDLDWLARNVHKWAPNELLRMKPCDNGNGTFRASWCYSGDGGFTKDQWLASRAELQNKPSWNEAPDWAKWLHRTQSGKWWFSFCEPYLLGNGWQVHGNCEGHDGGEVLGDWRDTIEKRPEDFKPFTSIEDNQEHDMVQQQEMKQDNGWFERGELPPAGTKCEFCNSDDEWTDWHQAIFVGTDAMGDGVVSVIGDDSGVYWRSKDPGDFRPIRTDRDVLVDLLGLPRWFADQALREDLADAILAAGFSLRDK